MRTLINTIALISIPAIAFASGDRIDNSGYFVWAFLGLCAMIVVAQIIPAVLLMCGVVKSVRSAQSITEKL